MYPRYQQRPMPYRMPQQSFHPYNQMARPMNGMMRSSSMQPQQRGGGLLSKLLGGFNRSGASQGVQPFGGLGAGQAAARGGGGLLKSLTEPNTINQFLTNTQKVLSTANQVGPLVQQYGPVVKNLPMMWKLYRGLKDAPEFNKETVESTAPLQEEQIDIDPTESSSSDSTETYPRHQTSPSKPKLYI